MEQHGDVLKRRLICPHQENETLLCGVYGTGDELDDFKDFDSRCDGCEAREEA